MTDGGWLKSHPLPSDKSSYGSFEALYQENKLVLKSILEKKAPTSLSPSYDEQLLRKLRGLYSSCMDEDELNAMGPAPLVDFVGIVRRLFRGKQTEVSVTGKDDDKEHNLTAALAFLHSRGQKNHFLFLISLMN
jgi:endothelin-converting enzyme